MGIFYETRSNKNNDGFVNTPDNGDLLTAFSFNSVPLSSLGYNEYKALRNSDLWTAVNLLSRDISKLDIKVKENGVYKENDRLEFLLNKRPNPYMNAYMMKYAVMMNALLTGHGYIKIERNPIGQVYELYYMKTSSVQLRKNEKGDFFYDVNTSNGKYIQVPFEDIIDIKPFTMDGINALKVLDSLEEDLNTQKFTKNFYTKFFANGGQHSGLLKAKDATLSPQARNKLRDEFTRENSGENNAGKVLVLDSSLEYEQLEIDSSLLDVINKNQTPTKAIAKALNIPLSKFGVEQPNTSLKDTDNDYLNSCLHGYMKTWEAELDFKLVNSKDQYTKEFSFDTSSFRKIDWEAYTENLRDELEKGAITHDEYREATGRKPYADGIGTMPRFDLNHISANVADDYQLRKTSTNNQAPNPDTSERG